MQTIEQRIREVLSEGIIILTVDMDSKKRPLPRTNPSADGTPNVFHDELLGYFTGGGAEYVVDKFCYTNPIKRDIEDVVGSAVIYGLKLDLFHDKASDSVIFLEAHMVIDPVQNKSHHFFMPHRNYLKNKVVETQDSHSRHPSYKWNFQC